MRNFDDTYACDCGFVINYGQHSSRASSFRQYPNRNFILSVATLSNRCAIFNKLHISDTNKIMIGMEHLAFRVVSKPPTLKIYSINISQLVCAGMKLGLSVLSRET
jgi:hypothetical protein